jgi:hypothetical protein
MNGMKFFYLSNAAELLIVVARNWRDSHPNEHYDFCDANNVYIGYLNARNDVDIDPKQAVSKGARRLERQLTGTRREIKEYHERAKSLKAASDMAATKDVASVPALPTMQEQTAARKVKEQEERRKKEEADRLRGVIKSVDPFDEFWSELSLAEQPRYGLSSSAAEVARIVQHYSNPRNTAPVRTLQETASDYNVPVEALTLNAAAQRAAVQRVMPSPDLPSGVISSVPVSEDAVEFILRQDHLEGSWPTLSQSTEPQVSPRDTHPTLQYCHNSWQNWSQPTPSVIAWSPYENPSTPPARP